MKLSIRIAGICASGTFLVTGLPGFYQHTKPTNIAQMATEAVPGMTILETMLISLGGALAAAFIGYIIGDILEQPKGKKQKKEKAKAMQGRQLSSALEEALAVATPAAETALPSEPAATEET